MANQPNNGLEFCTTYELIAELQSRYQFVGVVSHLVLSPQQLDAVEKILKSGEKMDSLSMFRQGEFPELALRYGPALNQKGAIMFVAFLLEQLKKNFPDL